MEAYIGIKHLHLLTVAISIVLFILRFFWKWRNSAMMERRWVKITPHVNDTVLFATGIALVFITHFYPFTPQGTWLTEKTGRCYYLCVARLCCFEQTTT